MLIANERGGAHSSDDAYKMAFTDALSVAGKMLGLAGDIYFQSEPTKYDASKDGDLSFHSIAAVKKRMEQRVTAIMQKGRSLEEVAKLCDQKLNAKTLSQIICYADKLAYVESRLSAIDSASRPFRLDRSKRYGDGDRQMGHRIFPAMVGGEAGLHDQ